MSKTAIVKIVAIEHVGLRMRILDQIKVERLRQISKEGWLPQHDAQRHTDGSLAMAAACYAAPEPIYLQPGEGFTVGEAWPWAREWDKRRKHGRKRQLVIAAALIVAELERLEFTQ